MDINISTSKNRNDYEILIRKRGVYEYSSYCPQINQMVKGKEHNEVKDKMNEIIREHIESLPDIVEAPINTDSVIFGDGDEFDVDTENEIYEGMPEDSEFNSEIDDLMIDDNFDNLSDEEFNA